MAELTDMAMHDFGIGRTAVSHHLRTLRDEHLVITRQEGDPGCTGSIPAPWTASSARSMRCASAGSTTTAGRTSSTRRPHGGRTASTPLRAAAAGPDPRGHGRNATQRSPGSTTRLRMRATATIAGSPRRPSPRRSVPARLSSTRRSALDRRVGAGWELESGL
ncbi:helix-turn-helix domain-containing protein [Pseudolysinimonas kribbensis]|uniref:helix-turn-helix domain-containing protein n=1 Tax=Pseudolysinimonas kribbensis TaxID=433641 RepID=UPI003D675F0A